MTICDPRDPAWGFPDPRIKPFPEGWQPARSDLETALKPLILSASGWRKVFASDGDEHSLSPELSPADKALCAAMAWVYADLLKDAFPQQPVTIAVGLDSRPTGPAIADILLRTFALRQIRVEFLSIVGTPEIVAAVQTQNHLKGFAYITASHNPVGHNGVKFGLDSGGVLGGATAQGLIKAYRHLTQSPEEMAQLIASIQKTPGEGLETLYAQVAQARQGSYASYQTLAAEILTGSAESEPQKRFLRTLRESLDAQPLGVLAEFNGSARATGPDVAFLSELGVDVQVLNERPRNFVHAIVPEGASLDLACRSLEDLHRRDPRWQWAYVPDCDGDRGNLVGLDTAGRARALEAQEGFALCVVAELAAAVHAGDLSYDEEDFPHQRMAVVVNDATSLRIEAIAKAFNVRVFRAEVGEANVVGLARNLRTQGWQVRILGEGSNGGNITHPGAVRDPLSTLGSLIKLLRLGSRAGRPGLFEIWCRRCGRPDLLDRPLDLETLRASLPAYRTTGATEDRALIRLPHPNHAQLKAAYERLFTEQGWREQQALLRERFGIFSWEEINYEGQEERRGFGPPFRSGRESGGLKILLKNQAAKPVGFLWMRGSGTEPVFRLMADIAGDDSEAEAWLLNWHRGLIERSL